MQPAQLLGLILCASFARNPRPLLGPILCKTGLVSTGYFRARVIGAAMLNELSFTELSRQLVESVSKVPGRVLQARLNAVFDIDVTDKLDQITVPSLYLRASHDRLVPKRTAELIIRNRKNWQLAELPGPHLLLQKSPHEAARVISEFAQRLTTERAIY